MALYRYTGTDERIFPTLKNRNGTTVKAEPGKVYDFTADPKDAHFELYSPGAAETPSPVVNEQTAGLDTAGNGAETATGEPSEPSEPPQTAAVPEETAETPATPAAGTGGVLSDVKTEAEKLIGEAEAEGEKLLKDAEAEAEKLIGDLGIGGAPEPPL
jgi:hypothetical protein